MASLTRRADESRRAKTWRDKPRWDLENLFYAAGRFRHDARELKHAAYSFTKITVLCAAVLEMFRCNYFDIQSIVSVFFF